jgi:hypothetical protein
VRPFVGSATKSDGLGDGAFSNNIFATRTPESESCFEVSAEGAEISYRFFSGINLHPRKIAGSCSFQ